MRGQPREGLLTRRQLDVLELVSHGLSNGLVAVELRISATTVKNVVLTILEDLGASDRAHAVRIGFEEGLLSAAERRPRAPRRPGARS